MSKIIHAMEFGRAVCKALDLDVSRISRIVIDIQTNDVLKLYVEYIGDDRILNIAPMIAGVEIEYVKAGEK